MGNGFELSKFRTRFLFSDVEFGWDNVWILNWVGTKREGSMNIPLSFCPLTVWKALEVLSFGGFVIAPIAFFDKRNRRKKAHPVWLTGWANIAA